MPDLSPMGVHVYAGPERFAGFLHNLLRRDADIGQQAIVKVEKLPPLMRSLATADDAGQPRKRDAPRSFEAQWFR